MEYSVTVPNATTSITVTGTKYDTNATVSAPMTLNSLVVGVPQVATITVTSQDGLTVKNYVITVFRASYTSSNIGNLMLVPAGTFYNGTANMMQTAFRMSQHDITQSQYTTVTGAANPSFFPQVTNRPVENVTWYDAVEFCNKLSAMEGLTSVYTITMRSPATGYPITRATVTADFAQNGYRLPTEMQWMWAAMGATSDAITSDLSGGINTEGYLKGYAGSSEPAGGIVHMSKYAWYSPYSGSVPHTVGTKRANELGIYDMSGNVWQWCWDWFSDSYPGVKTDYLGAASGTSRVMRGGSWFDNVYYCSVARRGREDPNYQDGGVGFRVVRP
jgi:formylglycine-generating enzyme required for sulfatase activity